MPAALPMPSSAAMPGAILLVDDDPIFRGLARRVLTADGLEIAGEAASVAEALDFARKAQPAAAMVDVGLPDGSGIELAAELAALPVPPRVVLVSSDRDAASPEDVRRCGAGAFVPKQDLPNTAWGELLSTR
jgi:DNA-binding NarL/FixJ family response regulator